MSLIVPIAMFGWPLVVIIFFLNLPPRRAVIYSMMGAWMFLPIAGYSLPGIPDVTKMSIACVSVTVVAMVFDPAFFRPFRWFWGDLFLLAWLLVPIPSCMLSSIGLYEGISGTVNQAIGWGLPFLLGRTYFSSAEALNELATAFFVAGLVYLPLVLFEVRMSPQLHSWIYGFHQHSFLQARRGGGFRATVFMQHGLAVATFMATATVCGVYLYFHKLLKPIYSAPAWLGVAGVIVGTLLCKSAYSILLMFLGIAALILSTKFKTRAIFLILASVPVVYLFARTFGQWDAQILRDAALLISEDRKGSLGVRLDSEDSLWKWLQGDVLFGRARMDELLSAPREVWGRFIPDGFWLIALGKYGMVGLVSVFGLLLAPVFVYLGRMKPNQMFSQRYAGATCLCLILAMYAMDNLLNAMLNPMFLLAAGGLLAVRDEHENSVPI